MRATIAACATFLLATLIASLLPSSTVAQGTVTLVSATLNSAGQTVTLVFTPPETTCSSSIACWFDLYHDTDDQAGFIDYYPMVNGQSVYTATVNVNNSMIPNGLHAFFVTYMSLPNTETAPSNRITVNVLQPQGTNNNNGNGSPAATIAGDPQFTGLRGQSYQVHGVPNEVFSIVSDTDLQYNSRFVLLTAGQCPTSDDGKVIDTPCFTHPGTYLGELGLETAAGDRIYIQAGAAKGGFESITLNGRELLIGEYHKLKALEGRPQPYIRLLTSHRVVVQAGNYWFEFTNSDKFVNQRVAMLDTAATSSHGLLGQTWSTVIYDAQSTIPWIEGSVFDYAMADHELFSHRFQFNRFHSAADKDSDEEEAEGAEEHEDEAEGEQGEEAALLERLQRLTAAKSRAAGKTASTHAHSHSHRKQWDL